MESWNHWTCMCQIAAHWSRTCQNSCFRTAADQSWRAMPSLPLGTAVTNSTCVWCFLVGGLQRDIVLDTCYLGRGLTTLLLQCFGLFSYLHTSICAGFFIFPLPVFPHIKRYLCSMFLKDCWALVRGGKNCLQRCFILISGARNKSRALSGDLSHSSIYFGKDP